MRLHRHGPLDQGAYNAFYQGRFDVHESSSFNWKLYHGYSAKARIVHFHGPKADEYVAHRDGVAGNARNLRGGSPYLLL